LAGLASLFALVLWRMLPADSVAPAGRPFLAQGFRTVLASRSALAGLAAAVLISAANEVQNIVYGGWMEQAFGLQVVALGAASAMIGIAELSGGGFVAGLSDRLGKRRAVVIGIGLNAPASFALPALGSHLAG
jgi:predicted MFS family arabinose efflux permease